MSARRAYRAVPSVADLLAVGAALEPGPDVPPSPAATAVSLDLLRQRHQALDHAADRAARADLARTFRRPDPARALRLCADPSHRHCPRCGCPLVVLAGELRVRPCVRCHATHGPTPDTDPHPWDRPGAA